MKKETLLGLLDFSEEEFEYYESQLDKELKKFNNEVFPFLSERPFVSLVDKTLYSYYSVLMNDFFDFREEDSGKLLALSHNLFSTIFLLDKLYDSQVINNPFDLMILLEIYSTSKKYMSDYIGVNEMNYHFRTLEGMYKEKYEYLSTTALSDDKLKEYCFDKYAYAKLAINIYNNFSKEKLSQDLLDNLCKSHDYFAYGRQILDDIEDYEEDLQQNRFNLYCHYDLHQAKRKSENHVIPLLIEAKDSFETAISVLGDGYSKSKWVKFIKIYLSVCIDYLNV